MLKKKACSTREDFLKQSLHSNNLSWRWPCLAWSERVASRFRCNTRCSRGQTAWAQPPPELPGWIWGRQWGWGHWGQTRGSFRTNNKFSTKSSQRSNLCCWIVNSVTKVLAEPREWAHQDEWNDAPQPMCVFQVRIPLLWMNEYLGSSWSTENVTDS